MNARLRISAGALFSAIANTLFANTVSVTSAQDNGPGNCSAVCTLRDAIATASAGDTITFAIALPRTITLNGTQLSIATPLTIQGPGAQQLTVSGNAKSRVLDIENIVAISGITFRDGAAIGAPGVLGSNGSGTNGTPAMGGCIYIGSAGDLTLTGVAIDSCEAVGGAGGAGKNDSFAPFRTGNGGNGGSARGGGIFSAGEIDLVQSSISGCSAIGGKGGDGGEDYYGYASGHGGVGSYATGGGIFAVAGALKVTNSTIAGCIVTGGYGGNGGARAEGLTPGQSGNGANASAGSVYVASTVFLSDIQFSTLTGNVVTAGVGGTFPSTASSGVSSADALRTVPLTYLKSSIVASIGSNSDCVGSIYADGENLDANSTCSGFTLHAPISNVLAPVSLSSDGTYSMQPIFRGPAIDGAAGCNLIDGSLATNDQHGLPRPQGPACDLGAIETDYIFADWFGG